MRRSGGIPLTELARLQQLAVLERRRELELACAETDRRDVATRDLNAELDRAEQDYAAVHGGERVCLSRLRVAAAIVNAGADALRVGQSALTEARSGEAAASATWQQARYRADWFDDRARDQRRFDSDRRADRNDAEARMLRLTRGA